MTRYALNTSTSSPLLKTSVLEEEGTIYLGFGFKLQRKSLQWKRLPQRKGALTALQLTHSTCCQVNVNPIWLATSLVCLTVLDDQWNLHLFQIQSETPHGTFCSLAKFAWHPTNRATCSECHMQTAGASQMRFWSLKCKDIHTRIVFTSSVGQTYGLKRTSPWDFNRKQIHTSKLLFCSKFTFYFACLTLAWKHDSVSSLQCANISAP